MNTAKEILLSGKERIIEVGWCQGEFKNEVGAVCALGSIEPTDELWAKVPSVDKYWIAYYKAQKLLSDAISHITSGTRALVVSYNDTPGRTVEEVLEVFDVAIKMAEESNV